MAFPYPAWISPSRLEAIDCAISVKLGKQPQPKWPEIVSSKACLALTSIQQRSATTINDPKMNVGCSVLHDELTEPNFNVTNLVTRFLSRLESKSDSGQ
jgi:hypothetical protein